MKKVHKPTVFALILFFLMAMSPFVQGQAPPPPGEKGGNNNGVPGGGAPIGSGIVLLITLAAGYGGKKVFEARKNSFAE